MNCDSRLESIFRSIFFELEGQTSESVHESTRSGLSTWDSAQHLLLLTCLEEEFQIKIPDDVAADLESYRIVKAYIENT